MTADELYQVLTESHPMALDFLRTWDKFTNAVDDEIDALMPPDAEARLALLAHAALVFSHSFYRQHADQLLPIVLCIINRYADSVAFERSEVDWQRQWGDTLRFCGNDMVEAVALATVGWPTLRRYSSALRERTWHAHHDSSGKPI